MNQLYNIYCDESCHLEHDGEKAMVLGGVWCPDSLRKGIARDIRNLKVKHGLNPRYEMKWNKISKGKLDFYIELVTTYISILKTLVERPKSENFMIICATANMTLIGT